MKRARCPTQEKRKGRAKARPFRYCRRRLAPPPPPPRQSSPGLLASLRLRDALGRADDLALERHRVRHRRRDAHVAGEAHVDLLRHAVGAEALPRVGRRRVDYALRRRRDCAANLNRFQSAPDLMTADEYPDFIRVLRGNTLSEAASLPEPEFSARGEQVQLAVDHDCDLVVRLQTFDSEEHLV